MRTYPVQFHSAEDICRFTRLMDTCEAHADLKYGSTIVDAKSLIGVFAIGIHRTLELILHGGVDAQFENQLALFAA